MARRQFSLRHPSANTLRTLCVLAIAAVGAIGCESGQTRKDKTEPEWISLFNGEDLEGWMPKFTGFDQGVNYKNTFRVQEGLLTVAYDKYEKFSGEFGHLFYKDPYMHYRLRLEYRFIGEQTPGGPGWAIRNSGIMIHCQPPATMTKDQQFPVCLEVQLLGGNGTDERTTGNLCTPGTHVVMNDRIVTQHCINSTSKTYHGDQWVTAEVEVHGNRLIRHLINGEVVLEYSEPQLDESDADAQKRIQEGADRMIGGGYIALQAESHPVQFRKVELLPLEPGSE